MEQGFKLKEKFTILFPEYAKLLESAKSEEEFDTIHTKLIDEQTKKFQKSVEYQSQLTDSLSKKKQPSVDAGIPFSPSPELYDQLINATGDDIEDLINNILNTMYEVAQLKPEDADSIKEALTREGILGLLGIVVGIAPLAVSAAILAASGAALPIALPGFAAFAAVVIAAAALMCLVMVPLFFGLKPAACFMLLLNETGQDLIWKKSHNIHGKEIHRTNKISPPCILIKGKVDKYYPSAGFFVTTKRDIASIGTTYATTVKCGKVECNFGLKVPLNHTDGKSENSCRAIFYNDGTKFAAELADENPAILSSDDSHYNLRCKIRCNSKKGQIAFYIARVYLSDKSDIISSA